MLTGRAAQYIYRTRGSASSAEVSEPARNQHLAVVEGATRIRAATRRGAYHALDAERLAVQAAFGGKLLDDLCRFVSTKVARRVVDGTRTDLSSASLAGLGHDPASKLIARKKLYAHKPKVSAKVR